MNQSLTFDYYYGGAAEQYAFYRIPRILITGSQFRELSTDAKLLYGLMLDRMSLSAKNGWFDDLGRVYIYFALEDIQEAIYCGHGKAVKLLAELDTGKGIGLIERVKQGQGRPCIIYVKQFTTSVIPPQEKPQGVGTEELPRLRKSGNQECRKQDVQTSEKRKSRVPVIGSQDFQKSDANYIKSNQTDFSHLNLSIHQSPSPPDDRWMDWNRYFENVKFSVDYFSLCRRYGKEDVDSIVTLIAEVLCSEQPTIRINGENLSAEIVKERFRQLTSEHIVYVFDSLNGTCSKIRNIRSYLITALFNAPVTMAQYYQAEVRHDFSESS